MAKRRYLWSDAEEANDASLKTQEKGKAKSTPPPPTYPGVQGSVGGTFCIHDGVDPEIEFDKKSKLWTLAGAAGRDVDFEIPENTRLILDFGGHIEKPKPKEWCTTGPEDFKKLNPVPPDHYWPPVARCIWSDRGSPPVPPDWWTRLVEYIRTKHAPGHIIFACVGGHGRTGTGMAALVLAACPDMSMADAVELVRETHCDRAIESREQMLYLKSFRPNEKLPADLEEECRPPKWATSNVSRGYAGAGAKPGVVSYYGDCHS